MQGPLHTLKGELPMVFVVEEREPGLHPLRLSTRR